MIDCDAVDAAIEAAGDPRLTTASVRCLTGDGGAGRGPGEGDPAGRDPAGRDSAGSDPAGRDSAGRDPTGRDGRTPSGAEPAARGRSGRSRDVGTVVLVGAVHDHPASVGRVAALLDGLEPSVLALELPPLAVPLFALYAADPRTPPRLGGEMATAIQAADGARFVGIDAPNREYLAALGRRVRSGTLPRAEWLALGRDLLASVRQALACRAAAALGRMTPIRLRVYEPIEYDCTLLDPPAVQAAHEQRYLGQRRAFVDAVELPAHSVLIDAVRETAMARRLDELRGRTDVVAVVGMEHLDPLAALLAADGS